MIGSFGNVVVSKMAGVEKERDHGTLDMLQSHINAHVRLHERTAVPQSLRLPGQGYGVLQVVGGHDELLDDAVWEWEVALPSMGVREAEQARHVKRLPHETVLWRSWLPRQSRACSRTRRRGSRGSGRSLHVLGWAEEVRPEERSKPHPFVDDIGTTTLSVEHHTGIVLDWGGSAQWRRAPSCSRSTKRGDVPVCAKPRCYDLLQNCGTVVFGSCWPA